MGVFSRVFGGDRRVQGPSEAPRPSATPVEAQAGTRRADVVVVGAGLAGLAAARVLSAAGVDTVVLEARDRVGGRTYTRPATDGTLIDLGGQWIGPSQDHLAALASELGCTTFKTFDTGKNVQLTNGVRAEYSGAIPTSDRQLAGDVIETLLDLTTMSSQVPLEAPWTAPQAAEWDAQTMATWMQTNIASPDARALVELAVQAVFSAEPAELSLLHCLFYLHSGGGIMNLIGVTGGAQESRFVDGAQSISKKMAAALSDRVLLNAPVLAIRQSDAGVRVVSDAGTVEARKVIVAVPPALASRIRYAPALPGYRDMLTQRVPMGNTFKIHCIYETPFWREDGLTGQATSDMGALRLTFDNSPHTGSPGVMMGFIEGGDRWATWARRSAEERRAAVITDLTRLYGEKAATPREYIEQSWAEEEYSRGCYVGNFPPGVWTQYGEALREPIGRIHWAGTETATVWNGYMDGAVQSGERAAAEVIAALDR